MTPEDNLEKYFKKVLNEDSPLSEAEWSIPSDDLWEAAKVHFPKKKKKDRAIFFWFGTGVFCLLLGFVVTSVMNEKMKTKIAITTDSKVKNEPLQNTNNTNQIINNQISTEKESAPTKKKVGIHKSKHQTKINNRIKQKERSIKTKKDERKNKLLTNSLKTIEEIKPVNPLPYPSNEIIQQQVMNSNFENKLIPPPKIAVLNSLKHPITFLEIPERKIVLKNNQQNLTVPVTPKIKQWEVGLSKAPFILIQESIINEGSTSNFASQTIVIKHQNVNLSVRRYLNKRFSVSSGLYLSKGTIDLTLCDKGLYDNQNKATLRYFIKESDATNQIKLTDIGLDFDASFEYKEDANLRFGDELTLKGNIPFKLKFIQMPLLFNIHFGKRKFKGLVHTGISLGYLSVKANDVKWEVFKETELISKPIEVAPLNEQTFKIRLQAGIGLRYAIKDFLQIGTGININISEPILSRYDFGVYYGF